MTEPEAHQTALLCANCGGQTRFDPEQGALVCQSCGTARDLAHPDDILAGSETPYDPDQPCTEAKVIDGVHVHACQTCGGEVVFTGQALSDHCPYCDGAVVLGPEDAAYRAMALIPFALEERQAHALAVDWGARRIAAPSDLVATLAEGRVAGLYAPFWTFDSEEAVAYWGTYITGQGKQKRSRSVKGQTKMAFDDLLVPASPHVSGLIRDGILHDFRPERLRAFRPGYLAGFAAERHHQTVAEGLRANAQDMDLLIRNRIRAAHNAKTGRSDGRWAHLDYRTDTTGIHYRRILVPVWVLHYRHRGKAYRIAVSGIDGRTFGERPLSTIKLALYAATGAVLTMAAGIAWGAFAVM